MDPLHLREWYVVGIGDAISLHYSFLDIGMDKIIDLLETREILGTPHRDGVRLLGSAPWHCRLSASTFEHHMMFSVRAREIWWRVASTLLVLLLAGGNVHAPDDPLKHRHPIRACYGC